LILNTSDPPAYAGVDPSFLHIKELRLSPDDALTTIAYIVPDVRAYPVEKVNVIHPAEVPKELPSTVATARFAPDGNPGGKGAGAVARNDTVTVPGFPNRNPYSLTVPIVWLSAGVNV
jgi:hypothetical protein